MHKSILAFAFFGLFAQQALAASGSYVRLENRDSMGGALYNGEPIRTLTETGCQEVCTADSACFGYTFVAPSMGVGLGFCYRKAKINCDPKAIMKDAPGTDSGIIGTSCTFQCGGETVTIKDGCSIVTPVPVATSVRQRMRRAQDEAVAARKKLQLCPANLTACTLRGLTGTKTGYECVDLQDELERCGACNNDCTKIPGAKGVACTQGKCMISSCGRGYKLLPGGAGRCIPLTKKKLGGQRKVAIANSQKKKTLRVNVEA